MWSIPHLVYFKETLVIKIYENGFKITKREPISIIGGVLHSL